MSGVRGSAIVTGASRGLGAVISRHLAERGWPVGVNYRPDAVGAQHVVDDVRRDGGRAEAFRADVTDETAVAGLVSSVAERLGPVTLLVVNVTGPRPTVPVERLTWRDHLDQLEFFGAQWGDELRRYTDEVPLRRMGVPDDVAAAVAFLASDDAAFITGERLTVNGGHTPS